MTKVKKHKNFDFHGIFRRQWLYSIKTEKRKENYMEKGAIQLSEYISKNSILSIREFANDEARAFFQIELNINGLIPKINFRGIKEVLEYLRDLSMLEIKQEMRFCLIEDIEEVINFIVKENWKGDLYHSIQ